MKHTNIDLPLDFKLLPGEKLIREKTVKHMPRIFHKVPSSLKEMQRLTRSRNARAIGKNGPSLAALAIDTEKSQDIALKGLSFLKQYRKVKQDNTPQHLRLFEVVFGRDSLRVAIELIASYPELARTTVLKLAELQGTMYHREREEEPGKIVHEARDESDVLAVDLTNRRGWGWPYYATVDATPEFVRTIVAYCLMTEENYKFLAQNYSDKNGERRSMAYALDSALEWIERRIDSTKEGLIEYKTTMPRNSDGAPKGLENHVWKDSYDAYHHSDGTLANPDKPIASFEVQVTTYDALLDAAELYEKVYADKIKANRYRRRAEKLKQQILQLFWTEDKGGYFVIGLDRDKHNKQRQLKIRTSNMGHALNSRLLEGKNEDIVNKRDAVIHQLLSPEMLNISGIRTLASDEVRFRAGAYHSGSVWLWDTHHIAKGFRRHGFEEIANELDRRILHVVEVTKMFPEYVRGDTWLLPRINQHTIIVWDEKMNRENCVEQPPQEVQAWTVAAILAIKKRLDKVERRSNPLETMGENIVKTLRLNDTVFGKIF